MALAQYVRFATQVSSSSSLAPSNFTRSDERDAAGDPSPKARKMTLMDGDRAKAQCRQSQAFGALHCKTAGPIGARFVTKRNRFSQLVHSFCTKIPQSVSAQFIILTAT
jgi:hypothetical protein